jgi:hypothetical protein
VGHGKCSEILIKTFKFYNLFFFKQTDNARDKLPLTVEKQETFTIGFEFQTGCIKKLVIGETKYPVVPMVHMLATHGLLLSFEIFIIINCSYFIAYCFILYSGRSIGISCAIWFKVGLMTYFGSLESGP